MSHLWTRSAAFLVLERHRSDGLSQEAAIGVLKHLEVISQAHAGEFFWGVADQCRVSRDERGVLG
jgi:hypothetical protein